MADTFEKRIREAKKRRKREMKAERKRLRKDGVIGQDNGNFFFPDEIGRESVNIYEKKLPDPPPPAEGEGEGEGELGAEGEPGAESAESAAEGDAAAPTPPAP